RELLPEPPPDDDPTRAPGNRLPIGLLTKKEGITGLDLGLGGITLGELDWLTLGIDLGGTVLLLLEGGRLDPDFDSSSFSSKDCPS
ncbi:MAG: hypothetical protein HN754_11835, partial [Opitutae bacterium]|nr:hypothetical protein [Opitutae bacterium]